MAKDQRQQANRNEDEEGPPFDQRSVQEPRAERDWHDNQDDDPDREKDQVRSVEN